MSDSTTTATEPDATPDAFEDAARRLAKTLDALVRTGRVSHKDTVRLYERVGEMVDAHVSQIAYGQAQLDAAAHEIRQRNAQHVRPAVFVN